MYRCTKTFKKLFIFIFYLRLNFKVTELHCTIHNSKLEGKIPELHCTIHNSILKFKPLNQTNCENIFK